MNGSITARESVWVVYLNNPEAVFEDTNRYVLEIKRADFEESFQFYSNEAKAVNRAKTLNAVFACRRVIDDTDKNKTAFCIMKVPFDVDNHYPMRSNGRCNTTVVDGVQIHDLT